jgi:hypothetical protein
VALHGGLTAPESDDDFARPTQVGALERDAQPLTARGADDLDAAVRLHLVRVQESDAMTAAGAAYHRLQPEQEYGEQVDTAGANTWHG